MNLASLQRRCDHQKRRISIALAQKGRGKTLDFHCKEIILCHEHPGFGISACYSKFNFTPKWYLFLERVTYIKMILYLL